MDAAELVPFSDPARAKAFAALHGGQVMTLAQILASALATSPATPNQTTDADIAARLRALSPTGG